MERSAVMGWDGPALVKCISLEDIVNVTAREPSLVSSLGNRGAEEAPNRRPL